MSEPYGTRRAPFRADQLGEDDDYEISEGSSAEPGTLRAPGTLANPGQQPLTDR